MDQEVIEYLSNEYMDCVQQEEEWVQKKYDLQAEQRRFEENLYLHVEEEQTRQLFSPLVLKNEQGKKMSQDNYQLSDVKKRLEACIKELEVIGEKKSQLKKYIHVISAMKQKLEEEKVEEPPLFLKAFYEILERMERFYPDTEFVYEVEEQKIDCHMSFHFLNMWKLVSDYLMDQMLIGAILFRIEQDENVIMIIMECESTVPLGNSAKKGMMQVLTKECELISWEENTFEIRITVK